MPYGGHDMQVGDRYILDCGLRVRIELVDHGFARLDHPGDPIYGRMDGDTLHVRSKPHKIYNWCDSEVAKAHGI